ncbi:DUF1761 domain-containing protein [Flavobacterium sp.]|uniref:DUF1761 domain-containing protein n=1 Tax=Flavobacterium sp. TaxID=239 RepID=UPI00345D8A00
MEINLWAVLMAALSSFVVGFIWYNPKVFGTIWMKEIGMTEEQAQKGNMIKIFGLTFVYSFMIAFMMQNIVIHQLGVISAVGGPTLVESAKPSFAHLWQITVKLFEPINMVLYMVLLRVYL